MRRRRNWEENSLDICAPLAYKGIEKDCRGRISMRDDLFAELVASVREGGAILRGEKAPSRTFSVEKLDIKQIRQKFGLTQSQFASLLGISIGTLRNWEQGRRSPEGPARVLLQVAAKHPDAVWDVVRQSFQQE
jgi:putative transcriptional regulator